MRQFTRILVLGSLCGITLLAQTSDAGPPYVTDDPEPVDLHHWEINLAIQEYHSDDGWSGSIPLADINYGLCKDVQAHIQPMFNYDQPVDGSKHFGAGDLELGCKYRFIHETDFLPQVALYPLFEVPTGNRQEGLGNGKAQVFVPVWIQKQFGKWTSFGGGGYWFNPGVGNHNYAYAGWVIQRKVTDWFTPGLEVQFRSAQAVGVPPSTALNVGGVIDLSETYHILYSAGHTVQGNSEFQGYLALQITFGPKEQDHSKK